MDQILKGLVLTGAWGCFDEFNRLEEATLSAISMQIQLIQNALLAKRGSVIFLDQKVRTKEKTHQLHRNPNELKCTSV